MINVIVYKPSLYGIVLINDQPLRLRPRVYHIKHIEQTYINGITGFTVTMGTAHV